MAHPTQRLHHHQKDDEDNQSPLFHSPLSKQEDPYLASRRRQRRLKRIQRNGGASSVTVVGGNNEPSSTTSSAAVAAGTTTTTTTPTSHHHKAEIEAAEAAAAAVISGKSPTQKRRMPRMSSLRRSKSNVSSSLATLRPFTMLLSLAVVSCIFGYLVTIGHGGILLMEETGGESDAAQHVHLSPSVMRDRHIKEKQQHLRGNLVSGAKENDQKIQHEQHQQQQQQQHQHKHAIPPILIFTHHTNLLTTPESSFLDQEDPALASNVKHTISQNQQPNTTVRFLTDNECLTSIQNAMGSNTSLVTYFQKETEGMYKADICRGAALYETGGLYFDIDIETRMSVWDVIRTETEFVVPLVHAESKHPGNFFQAFIGVTPQHPIMKRYLELFIEYYEGRKEVHGPVGVILLREAFNEVYKERKDWNKVVQFWQEMKYDKKIFPHVKAPNRGERRACKFVVYAPPSSKEEKQKELKVPFYSRVKGSRMCGGRDTHKKG